MDGRGLWLSALGQEEALGCFAHGNEP